MGIDPFLRSGYKTPLVDELLGVAYKVVRDVHDNLGLITNVEQELTAILSVANNLAELLLTDQYAAAAALSETKAKTSETNAKASETAAAGSATAAAGSQSAAATSAATAAANAASAVGTSASNLAIATGTKTFVTQAGKLWQVGSFLIANSSADPVTNYMFGQITAYTGTSLTLEVSVIGGTGSHADWKLQISGPQGGVLGGVGTIASQNANSVNITGGNVSGIVDLLIADGGTGASTPAAARSNLGVVIGQDVQAHGANLDALTALVTAADKLLFATGPGAFDVADFPAAARAFLAVSGVNSEQLINLGVSATVAASALTVAIKQADGGTNPSATKPVLVGMRSATAGSGAINQRSISGALLLVVPSTATLGQVSGAASTLYVYLIDNAGTLEVAISATDYGTSGIVSTTLLNTAADLATPMYSTTARTNVPFRKVAEIDNTQATAGLWATAPSAVRLPPFSRPLASKLDLMTLDLVT